MVKSRIFHTIVQNNIFLYLYILYWSKFGRINSIKFTVKWTVYSVNIVLKWGFSNKNVDQKKFCDLNISYVSEMFYEILVKNNIFCHKNLYKNDIFWLQICAKNKMCTKITFLSKNLSKNNIFCLKICPKNKICSKSTFFVQKYHFFVKKICRKIKFVQDENLL